MIRSYRPFRVAVSGAPGVGKTTLIRELGSRLAAEGSVEVSTEIARVLAQHGVRINMDSEAEDYLAFMAKHVERLHSLTGDFVLFDRTLLDVLAFLQLRPPLSPRLHELAEELCRLQLQMIDVYFFVPPEFQPPDDDVRLIDSDALAAIDHTTLDLLSLYRPDFVCLRGSVDDRANHAIRNIELSLQRYEDDRS